ncbi:MAG: hypothetical protein LUF86_02720 [Clostridiales bacterium]|nr:hypothetical protein [Clostridiales bacterium]
MSEIIRGQYANMDSDPPAPESWHFYPKKKGGKVGYADALQELFDQGMSGNLYVQLYRVPDEFPADVDNDVVLLEPEDAIKFLADWCRYTLHDEKGELVE